MPTKRVVEDAKRRAVEDDDDLEDDDDEEDTDDSSGLEDDDEEIEEDEDDDLDDDDDDESGSKKRKAASKNKRDDDDDDEDGPVWKKKRLERAQRQKEREILDKFGVKSLAELETLVNGKGKGAAKKTKPKPEADDDDDSEDSGVSAELVKLRAERDQARRDRVIERRGNTIERLAEKAGALKPARIRAIAEQEYPKLVDRILSVDDDDLDIDPVAAKKVIRRIMENDPELFADRGERGAGSPPMGQGKLPPLGKSDAQRYLEETRNRMSG